MTNKADYATFKWAAVKNKDDYAKDHKYKADCEQIKLTTSFLTSSISSGSDTLNFSA